MINKRAKGERNKLEAKKILEENGYLVGNVETKTKFNPVKDLFGLFDLAAINNKEILLVQISSNQPHTHKQFLEFAKERPIPNVRYLQLTKKDRVGWFMYEYLSNGEKITKHLFLNNNEV